MKQKLRNQGGERECYEDFRDSRIRERKKRLRKKDKNKRKERLRSE